MKTKNKLVLTFLSLSIFLILLWISTLSNQYKDLIDLNISDTEIWSYELTSSWKKLDYKLVTDDDFKWSSIYYSKLNLVDDLYFETVSDNDLKIAWTGSKINYNLWAWIYLFNLNDWNIDYEITWTWFYIKMLSNWKFLINNKNPRKVSILSLDSILDFNLINTKTLEKMTWVYLYPHMYFDFSISRVNLMKNSDMLKLSKIFTLEYINNSLVNNFNEFNPKILDLLWDESKDFLKVSYESILRKYSMNEKKFYEVRNYTVRNVSWISYIQKYFTYFMNTEKKEVYYKNLILSQINDLFKNNEINNDNVSEIYNNLQDLKDFSPKWYSHMLDLTKSYYKVLVSYNDISYLNPKINFFNLLSKLEWKKKKDFYYSFLYLNSVYSSMDSWRDLLDNKYSYILKFVDHFFDDLWVRQRVEDKKTNYFINVDKNYNSKISFLDYYSFLLWSILSNSFSLDSLDDRKYLINLLWRYITINDILSNKSSSVKKLTIVYHYYLILEVSYLEIKDLYFQKDRDEKWLLLSKQYVDYFTKQEYNNWLKKHIEYIIDYYKLNNKYFLNNVSDNNLKNNFDKIIKDFEELLFAVSDYQSYTARYDKVKWKILWVRLATDLDLDLSLSNEKFYHFIKIFNGINIDNINIYIKRDYYQVSWIIVNWKKISFRLYPNKRNRITNIEIDWEIKPYTYDLDEIKSSWEWKNDNLSKKDKKDNYDFANFFVLTFKDTEEKDIKKFDLKEKETEEEDKFLVVFKKDILLWSKWEFKNVKDFLNLKYDNLIVKSNWNDNYDIYLTWAKFTISTLSDNKRKSTDISWELSASYVFSDTDHYFKDIEFYMFKPVTKIIRRSKRNTEEELDLDMDFWWAKIKIDSNIELFDIEYKMKSIMWSTYEQITKIYNLISVKWAKNISFVIWWKKLDLLSEFNYKGKNIKVSLEKNGDITSLYIDNNNIVKQKLNENKVVKSILYLFKQIDDWETIFTLEEKKVVIQ